MVEHLVAATAVPEWFWYVTAFVFGSIIGSFLNVYIYRFHTGKSLSGSSHCLSCGERLQWYELVPVLSYVWIRGRCRGCHSKVPLRYVLVELSTACLFVLALLSAVTTVETIFLWVMCAILVVIVTYDIYHFIIPDALTLALTSLVVVLTVYEFFVHGRTLEAIGFDVLGAFIGSLFLLLLWLISKGEWLGFGDVKLAFPLGLLVGAKSIFSFVVMSFWIGAGISLALLAIQHLQRGKSHLRLVSPAITMKSAVPFAPFLVTGALVTFFGNINVLSFFNFTF